MRTDPDLELTTSRISRLLRPLRVKCTVLASFTAESARKPRTNCSTHASFSRNDTAMTEHDSPLILIPPPEKLRTFSRLDKSTRDDIVLSKALYDVRDAFQNVVKAGLSRDENLWTQGSLDANGAPTRTRSLAAICAAVIGEHIEEQIIDSQEERIGDDLACDEELVVTNECYDAVPAHYRRYTLLAHALSVVLATCAPHFTLLHILLDVTVAHGLKAESEVLLHALLEVAIIPQSSASITTSPITYPTQATYLSNLRDRLCEARIVNDRRFVCILRSVLRQTPCTAWPDIWTSKAVVRLARRFRADDYEAFVSFCTFLAQDIIDIRSSRKAFISSAQYGHLCDRLAKWLEMLCERLARLEEDTPTLWQEMDAAIDMLLAVYTDGCFERGAPPAAHGPIMNALTSLALICSSRPYDFVPHDSIVASLQKYRGANIDTFNPIISAAFSTLSKDDHDRVISAYDLRQTVITLRRWAAFLHTRGLWLLEARFWSNVLAQIEALSPEIGPASQSAGHRTTFADELESLRKDTVKRIEDVERRHYNNSDATTSCAEEQTPRKAASVAKGSQFRWDELMDCWVAKTPPPIKCRSSRKRSFPAEADHEDVDHPEGYTLKRLGPFETPTRPRALSSRSVSTSISSYSSSRSSRSSASTSPRKSATSSRRTTPDGEENTAFSQAAESKRGRRKSNFGSVLADAKSNRVVLHGDDVFDYDLSAEQQQLGLLGEANTTASRRRGPSGKPLKVSKMDDLSSDDIDLLAYHSSEQ